MSSDEDDILRLYMAKSKPLQAYNCDVGIVNTAGAAVSASSSDSDDESFSSGRMDVSTSHRVHGIRTPGRFCYLFHGPWCP